MATNSRVGANAAKQAAAARAVHYVEDGMRIGLGSGTTASIFVRELAKAVDRNDWNVSCVSTSSNTARIADDLGLKLVSLNEVGQLDIVVDGADEIAPEFNLLKGGGGALLQEKIVAAASEKMVVVADRTKLVESLGSFPLPVEITRFGWMSTKNRLETALGRSDVGGTNCRIRGGETSPFLTDEGNYILDLSLGWIGDPYKLDAEIQSIPGVIETGLFLDLATTLVIGLANGDVRELRRRSFEHRKQPSASAEERVKTGGEHV
ncbi:MAG: ribose-5-phosphate isomerase RpiA [Albidovulum sp.]|nr:ribose-5-phosphate isomerase RpiA [Albidovulum sp.]MDE0307343.1 ribose-5-phosphate isomerase RpiA [Albidovulum sp.]MDE0531685.1 ribose-5-phosphate isomerase RpiA [Albidovulum sp.]